MTLLDVIAVLTTPSCWIQNEPYSPAWDAECRRLLMEKVPLVRKDRYHGTWGPYDVWLENHPYASFTLYNCDAELKHGRPSRSVILRAYSLIRDEKNTELSIEAFIAGKQGLISSSRAVERAAGNL